MWHAEENPHCPNKPSITHATLPKGRPHRNQLFSSGWQPTYLLLREARQADVLGERPGPHTRVLPHRHNVAGIGSEQHTTNGGAAQVGLGGCQHLARLAVVYLGHGSRAGMQCQRCSAGHALLQPVAPIRNILPRQMHSDDGRQHPEGCWQSSKQLVVCASCNPTRTCSIFLEVTVTQMAMPSSSAKELTSPAQGSMLAWCSAAGKGGKPSSYPSACLNTA